MLLNTYHKFIFFFIIFVITWPHGKSSFARSQFGAFRGKINENLFNLDKIEAMISMGVNEVPQISVSNYGPHYKEEDTVVPKVRVPGFGTARGKVLESLFGREFFAFHSIPYATPPTGDLRFKMPEPWEGEWPMDYDYEEYDATLLRAKCPQPSLALDLNGGREDCLHISIYTPNTIMNEDKKYPVMFFIHGGAFVSGDASLYIPTRLMNRDVVVVVVQYRLGTLGFLSSGTPDNPGNMGLGDQIMALRWVKDYISYFGGDPDVVTVFGQSAGSASTSWMLFTPLTNAENNGGKPLLHRAITESGSALDVWAHDSNPQTSFVTEANEVRCWNVSGTQDNLIDDALLCMRKLPFQEIVAGCMAVYLDDREQGGLGFIGVSPVIQKDLALNYPQEVSNDTNLLVILDHPLKLIEKGLFLKVPLIAGSVRDEGSLVLGLIYEEFLVPHGFQENEEFLSTMAIPMLVNTFGIVDVTGAASNAMKLACLRNVQLGNFEEMSPGMVDMTGMLFLKTGMWTMTQLMTKKNPSGSIFFYSFEFESDDSIFPWYFYADPTMPIKGGITHADDLLYQFYLPAVMDLRERRTIDRFTRMWTNFAKYGDPTPLEAEGEEVWQGDVDKWEAYTTDGLQFMLMSDNFTIESDFTLRWNYHAIPDECEDSSTLLERQKIEIESDLLKSKDEELNGWKIGVASLGACCLLLVLSTIFILLRFSNRN